jgi:hypothetical protein
MNSLVVRVLATALCAAAPLSAKAAGCVQTQPAAHLEVVDRERGHLPAYSHPDGWFIEGTKGHRYEIVVCNPTPMRVLAVVSVDGVNVITGETAATEQAGYVIAPYGSATIPGWRKSTREAAAFYFTHVDDSYAGRTGRPANAGVIGAAFFHEARRVPPSVIAPQSAREAEARNEAAGTGAAADSAEAMRAPAAKLGTGHGERVDAPVTTTRFERQGSPFSVVSLRYESRARLRELGILPMPAPPPTPNPFPGGFVPDPPRRY